VTAAAVLCLRPRADFERTGALPPPSLEVTYRGPGDADVPALMQQSSALVIPAVGPPLSPALFEGTALKLIQVTGAGLDRLDRPTIERLGVPVANVPGGSNRAVAEYAVTMAATLLRRFAWADAEIRRGRYSEFRARMVSDNLGGLDGLLVGVVGLGTIGVAVAGAFQHMGCRICFHDPVAPDTAAAQALGAEAMHLDELLTASDVVTLHLPLLPATRNLIGDREMALMKPGAVLIQASRGGTVDEVALASHLRTGHLGGAAIDVYSSEPPAADHALLTLDGDAARRVLFTPHVAGVTRESAALLCRSAWQNVERVLIEGAAPLNRAY
jgi:phosphoglycerate dehydrogenase-like enzyme